MTNSEICVPSKLLAIDGTTPQQGDDVEVTSLKGKVTRIEGDKTYFQPTEINGQPVEQSADENAEGEDAPAEPTEESLRKRAEEEDQASITA